MSFLTSEVAPILFPSVLWRTAEPTVHLTFDDGPHPSATPKVLEVLANRGIRATFFLVGNNARQYPALAREIKSCGHRIGSHGLSHQSLCLKPIEFQRDQIEAANSVLEEIVGERPRFFRPPFGYFDFRTLKATKEAGQTFVMWNLDPRDFDRRRTQSIVQYVSKRIAPGSILLLHDNEKTAGAISEYLGLLLDNLALRGIQFSSLPL